MADDDEKRRLLNNIIQETEFFTSVIDTIPPEHYGYDEETREILRERKHTLVDEKLSAAKRVTLSNKTKARLAQLDERQCRTNSQIFAYLLETMKREKKGKKRPLQNGQPDPKGNAPSMSKKAKKDKGRHAKPVGAGSSGISLGPISSERSQLLSKLQAKLDEMRAKRGAASGPDYEEKKRLQRRLSKAKFRERRRQEKDQKGPNIPVDQKSEEKSQNSSMHTAASKTMVNGQPSAPKHQPTSAAPGTSASKRARTDNSSLGVPAKKPAVIDKDGRMVFSKFDFALPGVVEETEKDKWAKKNSGKDYKRLLEKQQKLQGKLEQLEESGNKEAAKKLKEKTQWDAAAQRAKGTKVKDDTALLKKNLKRKEKRKDQSKRKWEARNEATQRKQQDKQQKRRDNIQARKKDKKERKLTKARKKGRLV